MSNFKHAICTATLALTAVFAHAGEQCEDNFTSSGNILVGQNYKSGAILNNANVNSAFERALQFTATHGFTITSSDKNTGLIQAVQETSAKGGVKHPLTIALRADGSNTVMAMSFTLMGIAFASADDVKKHFCSTVAAVGAAAAPALTVNDVQQAAAARPAQRRALVGYASITPEQSKAVEVALMKSIPSDRIRAMVIEAAPAIATFAERLSCLSQPSGAKSLNEFAAPNTTFEWGYLNYPMFNTKYHDKAYCMTILRIHGWEAPANNALKYEVQFKAEDSGEVHSNSHVIVKQSDGTWLFKQ